MEISIISATDRPNAKALEIAVYLKSKYEELGVEVRLVSLEDFPIKAVAGGKYGKEIPEVTQFREPILNSDALLFVIPEYNGSYPGILKLFIDYLPFPSAFLEMPIAFIGESRGVFGGLRAVEQFQMVVNYRNGLQFPERVFIPKVHEEFDPEIGIKNDFRQQLLDSQTNNFVKFIEAVQGK